jgi:pre-mRNA-splicing factor RBM22/SLT11
MALRHEKINDDVRPHGRTIHRPPNQEAEKKPTRGRLVPPQDTSITTLYVGGIKPSVTQASLRAKFAPFGELQSVAVMPKLESAFVTFVDRRAAEQAARTLFRQLNIDGLQLSLAWGRGSIPTLPNQPLALQSGVPSHAFSGAQLYPSMDPTAMGSNGDRKPRE